MVAIVTLCAARPDGARMIALPKTIRQAPRLFEQSGFVIMRQSIPVGRTGGNPDGWPHTKPEDQA